MAKEVAILLAPDSLDLAPELVEPSSFRTSSAVKEIPAVDDATMRRKSKVDS